MKAAVFDMDGLLIDSEPLWRQAEKSTFREVGIELTDQMCHETLGLRADEVVAHWYGKFSWTGPSLEEVEIRLVSSVQRLISAQGQPLKGVCTTLSVLRKAGFKLGLASSSPHVLIETVVGKLDVRDYFAVMCSAVDEDRGKPHPAVYLKAAEKLGVDPTDCIAFEDAVSGIRSAKSAGMSVIAVPAEHQYCEREFEMADIKLRSLAEFSIEMLGKLRRPSGA